MFGLAHTHINKQLFKKNLKKNFKKIWKCQLFLLSLYKILNYETKNMGTLL